MDLESAEAPPRSRPSAHDLRAQSGYRENVITSNTAEAVNGATAVNLGNNACNGTVKCP